MTKEYVCSVDGTSFSTQEELVSYVMNEFVDEVEIAGDHSLRSIQEKIESTLPHVTANVSTRPYVLEKGTYDRPYKGTAAVDVVLSSSTKTLHNCSFAIQDTKEDGWYGITDYFYSLDEALAFYHLFFEGADLFAERAYDTLKEYIPTLRACSVDIIRRSGGTADSFNEYHLQIHNDVGDVQSYGYLELTEQDIVSKESICEAIDTHLQRVKGKFVTEIEGIVTVGTPNYCNDHTYWYEIDGIAIRTLLKRGKKARLEILEEKE